MGRAARVADPARRRAPRAGRRVRRGRLRAGDGQAGRRDHDHRPGRGQHARRGRRGVGVAVADPRDRHRHPERPAPARRVPRRPARDRRPGGDVRAGREVRAPGAARGDAVAPRSRPPCARRSTAPTRPVYLEIATDLLAAEVRRRARGDRASRTPSGCRAGPLGRRRGARRRAPAAHLGRRRRPRRRRRRARASPSGSPRPSSPPTARRASSPPGHPSLVGLPPHVEAAGRLWDEADVVVAIGSDLDGVQTQNFAQPQPETLVAIGLEAPTNYRVDVHVAADASAAADARRSRRPARRRRATSPPSAPRPAPAWTPPRCASWTRCASRVPADAQRRRRHVHPRLLDGRVLHALRARAGCRSRSAGARSATRSRPRSARRWPAPARRSRSAATAASCSRAASSRRWRRSRSR